MALLSADDRKRVEAKIREVEARTAGEVVVAVVGQSSAYAGRRLVHALVFGVLAASVTHHLVPSLEVDWVLVAHLAYVALAWLALGVSSVLRRLVPHDVRDGAVEERAARLFTERGVFDTRDHSGVLIMVSELEHKVVMLGDRGIHARIETDGWQRYVATIIAAIREGRPADGLCNVLDELGAVLADAFPRREDDENELPNAVIREER
jgi:putative membrane protein